MKSRIFDVFIWIMTFVFIGSVFTMPDVIPIHWDSNWQVDGYGSRYSFIIISLIPILTYYGMLLSKRIDPNKKKFIAREKTFDIVRKALSLVFVALAGFFYYLTMNPTTDGSMGMGFIMGIMFVVIGNFMPKFPQNYFLGIKTPWTLANEEVWKKSHHFGGYAFVLCGVVNIVAAIIFPKAIIITLLLSVVIEAGVTLIYSYVIYKKIDKDIDDERI